MTNTKLIITTDAKPFYEADNFWFTYNQLMVKLYLLCLVVRYTWFTQAKAPKEK